MRHKKRHHEWVKGTDAPVGKVLEKESDAASAAWCVVAGERGWAVKRKLAVRKCVLQKRAGIVVVTAWGPR